MTNEVCPIPFAEFRSRIDILYSTGRHAPKTVYRIRQVLRELHELGVRSTSDLTTEMIARYVTSKDGLNPNTINGLLSTISACCTYAVEELWLGRRPIFRRLRLREQPAVANVPRDYHEIANLLDYLLKTRESWIERRICALTWTVALTGVRRDEAVMAWCEDLDLGTTPCLKIEPRHRLKTKASARTVPVPEALAEVLRPWKAEQDTQWLFPGVRKRGPWTGGSPGWKSIDHLRHAAFCVGIDRITWHSLRHAYGTYALENWEMPLWIVQRVLGHTDVRTTQRYLHLDKSPAIARAAKSIGYRSPQAL